MYSVLMLDIDGVLATEQAHFYWEQQSDSERGSHLPAERLCPIAISNLNYACEQIDDLRIVISSSWRLYFNLTQIQIMLQEDGFRYSDRVIGMTPARGLRDSSKRYLEIKAWVCEHVTEVRSWFAVDDHPFDIPGDRLIQTTQETGFTIEHAYQLIKRLNPKWKRPLFMM